MQSRLKSLAIGMYWLSMLVIVLGILSITLGQMLPFEFTDGTTRSLYYDCLFQSLPLAVLLLPLGLARRNTFTKWQIGTRVALAASLAILTYALIVFVLMWQVGFARWTDYWILYQKRTNPQIKIVDQLYDAGAFGYGGHRIVQMQSLGGVFALVTPMDTSTLAKEEWLLVNKEGEVHLP